jgi:hypothetical protein
MTFIDALPVGAQNYFTSLDRSFMSSEHANIRAAEDQRFPPKRSYQSSSCCLIKLLPLELWISFHALIFFV